LTLIFVGKYPVIFTFRSLGDQSIVAKTGIDKGISISLSEIDLGRIKLSFTCFILFKMGFENLVGVLGIDLIQVFGKLFVLVREFLLGNQ
jgi:RNA-binding protein YhbY